jgi:hypothetical protein
MNATLMPTVPASAAARPMPLESGVFRSGVVLRLNAPIEDLRGHGEAAVQRLRDALAAGVPFIKDRKRARCYEVHLPGERFYIHVLRNAAKVLLLAHWEEERA